MGHRSGSPPLSVAPWCHPTLPLMLVCSASPSSSGGVGGGQLWRPRSATIVL